MSANAGGGGGGGISNWSGVPDVILFDWFSKKKNIYIYINKTRRHNERVHMVHVCVF